MTFAMSYCNTASCHVQCRVAFRNVAQILTSVSPHVVVAVQNW